MRSMYVSERKVATDMSRLMSTSQLQVERDSGSGEDQTTDDECKWMTRRLKFFSNTSHGSNYGPAVRGKKKA